MRASTRWFAYWLLCGACLLPVSAQAENYAFLVAVQDYDVKDLKPLKFTRGDILELSKLLRQSGFENDNIVVMTDKPDERRFLAESEKIRAEFDLLLAGIKDSDTLIVAFSGHGVQFEGEDKSYYCPADANLDDPKREKLISLSEIYEKLKACPAQRKLLLVDACRNDPMSAIKKSRSTVVLKSVTRPQSEPVPKGLVALFSCAAGQESYEWPDLKHGVFFHHVLEGWKGKADDGDKDVTLNEVVNYATERTQRFARLTLKAPQTPQLKSDFEGSWVLRKLTVGAEAEAAANRALEFQKKHQYEEAIRELTHAISLEEKFTRALGMRAWNYNKIKKFDLAISDANRALAIKPDYSPAYFSLGVAYGTKGDTDQSLKNFSEVIRISSKNSDAYSNRALAWNRKGDLAHALEDCDTALKSNPKSALAYETRGFIHRMHNHREKAISDLTRAIEIDEKYARAYFNRALAYGPKRDHDQAVHDLTRACELEPKSPEYQYFLGVRHEELGAPGYDLALASYNRAIEIEDKYAPAYYNKAIILTARKEFDPAMSALDTALTLRPRYASAYNARGVVWSRKANLEKAIEDYTSAIKYFDKYALAYSNRALSYSAKADQDLRNGKNEAGKVGRDQAIADFSKAIEIEPKNSQYYFERGLQKSRKGLLDEAFDDFLKARQFDPKSFAAEFQCGLAYSRRKDYDKAIASFTRALELDRQNLGSYSNRGAAYLAQGKNESAILDFNNAIAIAPGYTYAYDRRADAYEKMGLTAKAAEDRKKAQSLRVASKSKSPPSKSRPPQ